MTKQETSVLMGILQTAYPRFYADLTKQERDEAIGLWRAMLSDVDVQTAKLALYKLIATCKFPPTIAEVRECVSSVKYEVLPDAGVAWAEVNAAIGEYGYYRQDEALASLSEITRQAVIRMGWQALCMSKVDNEMADRAHFFRIYESLTKRIEQDRLLPDALRGKIGMLTQALSMDDNTPEPPALSVIEPNPATQSEISA